jgi:hypothetical protein
MDKSMFQGFVDKYFTPLVGKVTERYNDQTKEPQLLFKQWLTEEYSADLNWGATTLNHSIVAADVVTLESPLPLKSRSVITNASGKLPKIGMQMRKGEQLITDINIMMAKGAQEAQIAAKIFDDVAKVIKGVDVRTEIMFQQALSTGYCLVDSDDAPEGQGIRVGYGYRDENRFKAKGSKWGVDGETPQDDVQQIFDKALEDGNTIQHVFISQQYFDLFRHSQQGRLLAANFKDRIIVKGVQLPIASRRDFLEVLADEYQAEFHVVNGSFKVEGHDGKRKAIKPWEQANVVAVPDSVVGRLVYGSLAEETNPVAGVTYEKSGSHILVKKYSKPEPLEEFTAAQSMCLPVIDGGDSIYVLTANETQSEG